MPKLMNPSQMYPDRDIQNPLGKHSCNLLSVAERLDPSNLTILWFCLHCYLAKPQHACRMSSEHPLLPKYCSLLSHTLFYSAMPLLLAHSPSEMCNAMWCTAPRRELCPPPCSRYLGKLSLVWAPATVTCISWSVCISYLWEHLQITA